MTWRICLTLAVLSLVLVGCGSRSGRGGKPTVIPYANVISLSPSTTEFLAGIGGAPYLVGRTDECDRPQSVQIAEEVVVKTKINFELIMEKKPDLIIYDTLLYGDDKVAEIEGFFKKEGVETLPYDPDTIEQYTDFGYRLAAKLHLESFNSTYMDKVIRRIEIAETDVTSNPRTAVLLGGEDGNYLAMGADGLHAAIITASGGSPVGPSGRKFQLADIESLIEMDPEVVFSDGAALEILNDPRLQGLTAVRERHVYDVEARALIRIGNRMDALIKGMHGYLETKPTVPTEADAA